MAGLGYKSFSAGSVLTAAQVQGYLQDQATMVFASSAARTSALASPTQGMRSFLSDSNSYWQYYEAYNSATNPGGASVAGWYPVEGTVLFAGKRSNTGASIPSGAYTVLSFNTFACAGSTTNTDTIAINSATAPSTFTVRKAGWYSVGYNVPIPAWSTTAGANRGAAVNRNSTTSTTGRLMQDATGPTGDIISSEGASFLLAAGDVLRFWLFQDSGVAATNNETNFSITYLRPASV